ncbi:MAG: alginate lyase family protein [Bacteroidota bacterium]|nr:alginate lyase family protein [Bacteroidota bacterium]
MKLKNIFFKIAWLLFLQLPLETFAQQTSDFYFYSPADINTIKESAQTPWGKSIVDSLKKVIDQRMAYPMDVPNEEGGYTHDYYCPIHNVQFLFDWNSPKSHYCPVCKKNWQGTERYDWAWISLVHNKNLDFIMANMYLFLISNDNKYAANIKNLLLDYARKYPGYLEHNRERKLTSVLSGKMFAQSLDEAVWAIDVSRAYAVAASAMTDSERNIIKKNYLTPCAELLMSQKHPGNWQVWHNGAIASLGVALKNDSMINVALEKPLYGYHAMMNKNVYKDGWWNEGSVVYHFYPLRAILLTAEAVRCRKINLYDSTLYKMFVSPIQMLYPDLTFPSLNDGWYGTSLLAQAPLYEIAALRYKDSLIYKVLSHGYAKIRRNSPEALINGRNIEGNLLPLNLKSFLFPDFGVGVLRSKYATVVEKYGPDGGAHGHPDKLACSIFSNQSEILPDLGTPAYGVPDCNNWYRKSIAHNTIVVDQSDQRKTEGDLRLFKPENCGGTIITHTNKAYPGVDMHRKLSLKNNKLKDEFICTSSSEHIYDYVLILTDSLNFGGNRDTSIIENYKSIRQVKEIEQKGHFTFSTKDARVIIKVNSARKIKLISGVAPGIISMAKNNEKNVYPLIIRMKDKNIKVQTTWILRK